eukprot:CAMPEP_0117820428 /NCGR_PEP_ID=MMETSP0949-20121206/2457_1 /TAXON_ID=44440 /ORGANISM="Chattonella subsalsa, Strain CCMP2191" /LENGTH=393 /DNA_ID=CAMNT_0005659371 /DNA_START=6 /DNA_END=1187 /DNA_ORIENTATION=-
MASSPSFFERPAVVMDVGRNYWKVGFAGEPEPRHLIPTSMAMRWLSDCPGATEEEWMEVLPQFVADAYFRFLICRPKERRVVIAEPLAGSSAFREALGTVLFRQMQVKGVVMIPGPWPALLCTGLRSGLVIEIGARETHVLPVFAGYPLQNAYQVTPLGVGALCSKIRNDLEGGLELQEKDVQNILAQACFVRCKKSSLEDVSPVEFPLSSGGNHVTIPPKVRVQTADILFEGTDTHDSIISIMFNSLKRCSAEIRKGLLSNIVVAGGGAMIPGICGRLSEEIRSVLDDDSVLSEYERKQLSCMRPALSSTCISSVFLPRNLLVWCGTSILARLEELVEASLLPQGYTDAGERMPDWLSISSSDWLFHSPNKAKNAIMKSAVIQLQSDPLESS